MIVSRTAAIQAIADLKGDKIPTNEDIGKALARLLKETGEEVPIEVVDDCIEQPASHDGPLAAAVERRVKENGHVRQVLELITIAHGASLVQAKACASVYLKGTSPSDATISSDLRVLFDAAMLALGKEPVKRVE